MDLKNAAAHPRGTPRTESDGRLLALFSLFTRLDRPWPRLLLFGTALAALFFLVFAALQRVLAEVSYAELVAALRATPYSQLALAGLACAASYISLIGYDWSALRYAGARVKASTVALTSFTAFALGNTAGFGAFTGGAVRLRLYGAAGVPPAQVAQVIGFNALSFGLGTLALGALGVWWGAEQVATLARLPAWSLRALAALSLLAVAAVLLACATRRHLRLWRWEARLPTPGLAVWQLAISVADMVFAGLVLWCLLPAGSVPFPVFLAFYTVALALGVLSHVPGGLGVFEAIILLAIGQRAPIEQVAGALLLYRVVYYLLPLGLAALLLARYAWAGGAVQPLARAARPLARAAARLAPMMLAALTFVVGMVLLVSGVTPSTEEAAELLALHVPLPLVESAHLVGSVCGLLLLVLARGLLHRLDAAWWGALVATGISFWLSLPKGLAWHEMAMLGFLFMLLLISRRQFDRRSSLFSQTFDPYWFACVIAALAALVWILFFAYRNVEYTQQLWWRFEFDAHAPRSLRALMAVALATLVLALWQLLRRPAGDPPLPSQADIARAAAVVAAQESAAAALALAGDKHLLFSESGDSFIMYGKQGRSWVALFDPVGPAAQWRELVWRFVELAHAHGGRAAFYQVRPESLPLYVDAGLRAVKLGEYAWVPLATFSLKGSRRAHLRTALNRAEREGLTFEVLPAAAVPPLLPQLRAISDAWLAHHAAREKGFSLGAFGESYLSRVPVALVRRHGDIVAFASLLETRQPQEASIDLMRYAPDAPAGTMDYLFAQLILHYQAQGTQAFGLGMAPLSGLEAHHLAPRWHRVGRLLFGHGERFYHFRGLRSFKEKFDPVWVPRYLAAPGGLASLLALADTATLIGRGRPAPETTPPAVPPPATAATDNADL